MEKDFLKDFIEQQLDIELAEIVVMFDDVPIQKAYRGSLHATSQRKLFLEYKALLPPGHPPFTSIANQEKGFKIWAKSADGWIFSTHLFEIRPATFYPKEGQSQWRAELLEAFLTRKLEHAAVQSECFGYIDKLDCYFDRNTEFYGENGEHRGGSRDWLQVVNETATSEVRAGQGDWSTFKVVGNEGITLPEFQLEVNSLLRALSLRMARRIQAVCNRSVFDNVEQLCFSGFNMGQIRHTGNQPLVPLVLTNNGGTVFIDTVQRFFKKNHDPKLLNLLFLVWDGETLSREGHRLQTAIALESFSKYINSLMKKEGQQQTEAEKTQVEEESSFYDLKKKVSGIVENLEWKFPGHLKRLANSVMRTPLNDSTPAIKAAGEYMGFEFSGQELKHWRDMRHPAAHGDSQFDYKEEDFYSCLSMLHRLVLNFVGWKGPRVYYGLDTPPRRPATVEKPVQTFDLGDIDEMHISF
jgi:hypothetical protein